MKKKMYYSIAIKDGKIVITIDYPRGVVRDQYDIARLEKAMREIKA